MCDIRNKSFEWLCNRFLKFGLLTKCLTHSSSHNALKNLAKVETYSGQTLTRFQAASRLVNVPLRQQSENSPYNNNNNKSKP